MSLPSLDEYVSGDPKAAWSRLVSDPDPDARYSEAAKDISRVFCERAKANLEMIVQWLRSTAYSFDHSTPIAAPTNVAIQAIGAFQKEVGGVPLLLESFWKCVGEVNLCGEAAYEAAKQTGRRIADFTVDADGLREGRLVSFADVVNDGGALSSGGKIATSRRNQ